MRSNIKNATYYDLSAAYLQPSINSMCILVLVAAQLQHTCNVFAAEICDPSCDAHYLFALQLIYNIISAVLQRICNRFAT